VTLRRRPPPFAPNAGRPRLYTGAALGGFGTSSTVVSAASQQIDFKPGTSIVVALQLNGTTSASTETILGCGHTGVLGWVLTRGGIGGNAGKIFFLLSGVNKNFTPPSFGICTFALVWRVADNHLLVTVNGGAPSDLGSIAYSFPITGTGVSNIGSPSTLVATSNPLTDGRVLAFALLGSELSAAQAQAATYTTGNRLAGLPAAATTGAIVDFNAARDFASTSFATKGSAPVTFAVATSAGQPSLTPCAETRYGSLNGLLWDSRLATIKTDANGTTYQLCDSFARTVGVTSALSASVEVYSDEYVLGNTAAAEMGLSVAGAWVSSTLAVPVVVASLPLPMTMELQLGAGSAKTWGIIAGEQQVPAGVSTSRWGTYPIALRVPSLLWDGTTTTASSMSRPTRPAFRIVVAGDSIITGFATQPTMTRDGIVPLMRLDSTASITCHGAGTDSVTNIASTAPLVAQTAALLVSMLDGSAKNTLYLQYMVNCVIHVSATVAQFTSWYEALLTAVIAQATAAGVPSLVIVCQSATQLTAPATEAANGLGVSLPNLRTALQSTIVPAFSTVCVYLEGAAGALIPVLSADGTHPSTDAAYKANVKTALTATANGY
jgi:hypothetical protein